MSSHFERLNELIDTMYSYELARSENMHQLKLLYSALRIDTKVDAFDTIFGFNAINLMGVGLSEEKMGEIQKGKYVQIVAILPKSLTHKRAKSLSLGYFGKADKIEEQILALIIEFVLRWRYEKSFLSLEQNRLLLERFGELFNAQ